MNALTKMLPSVINPAVDFCKDHATELLIGVGISGFVGSIISAIKATKKAVVIEQVEEANKRAPLTKAERLKLVGKMYIPTIILVIASGACIVCGTTKMLKANTALTVALGASERALTEYKKSVESVTPPDKISEIEQVFEKNKEITERRREQPDQDLLMAGNTMQCLFREGATGRYFICSEAEIDKICGILNRQVVAENGIEYNTFYSLVGLCETDVGATIGWNSNMNMIDVRYTDSHAPDGRACRVVNFTPKPTSKFRSW